MKQKFNGVYILSCDAKDLYLSNHYEHGASPVGYNIRNADGIISTKRFLNTLDYSLDLIKMREIYERVYRRMDFGWFVGDKEYTQRVINVTFKYSVKAYNRVGKDLYVKLGWNHKEVKLINGVDLRGEELVAIQCEELIQNPVDEELLGKYFWYEEGKYHAKQNIKTVIGVEELRKLIYEDGFYCDGIHYIRFKRSSGSSRVGKCLFIDEKLYKGMDVWARCGVRIRKGQEMDLAGWESYIALTTSSIIDTIEINPEQILVIDDFESTFKDDVIATRISEDGRLVSNEENVKITNSIWDGQSLMDAELFTGYDQYGMLLLRNRFFKSACFNTNIQWFFKSKGITDISQLNGRTRAKSIEDIKLITTPSSIKYLKFGSLDQWLDNLDPIFGIVKHEKPTHFFDGEMVQTHYQLLNTLQLTYEEMEEFLQPALDYVKLVEKDPVVLRNHIKYPEDKEWFFPFTPLENKNDIVYKLLGLNDKFAETRMYAEFRNALVRSMYKSIKSGHVLVNGNYSTLLGNPLEMLYSAIGKWDGESILGKGNVYSLKFEDGQDLLGSRSPHICAGNVLLVKNTRSEEIFKYFNLSQEIVAINSIGENILQKLNGADFDSDTMLLTDNEILIRAAKRNEGKFKVPTNFVEASKIRRVYDIEQKADLDFKNSHNLIGEDINLSQELNTLLWDRLNHGESFEELQDIYIDICTLAVMSNLFIDSAKKEFSCDLSLELRSMKEKYRRRDEDGRLIKPNFFGHVARQKGYYDSSKKNYKRHLTSMDYLQEVVNKCKRKLGANKKFRPFSDVLDEDKYDPRMINWEQIHRVVDLIRDTKSDIEKEWSQYMTLYCDDEVNREGKQEAYRKVSYITNSLREDCSKYIGAIKLNYSTTCYLLKILDKDIYKDITTTMFAILFGEPNESFFRAVKKSKKAVKHLMPNKCGNIEIFGNRFSEVF